MRILNFSSPKILPFLIRKLLHFKCMQKLRSELFELQHIYIIMLLRQTLQITNIFLSKQYNMLQI
jgi:hypothetical protein